jgi:WD40 repeat protein
LNNARLFVFRRLSFYGRWHNFFRLDAACVLFLALCFFSTEVSAAKRIALVIANANYKNASKLINPMNDASLIRERLEQLGFKVSSREDVSSAREVLGIVQEFAETLDGETVALFYYAGHGIQYRGENLLVGTDAQLSGEISLRSETFPLNTIVTLLEGRAETSILFWDACRNNPLANRLYSAGSNSSAIPVGAAPVAARSGNTFIVLSAAAGKEALDGNGKNSPFAEALGRRISTPDIEVQEMLTMVTGDVVVSTQGRQRPDRSSQLSRSFYFNPQSNTTKAYEEELKRQFERYREAERAPPQPQQQYRVVPASKRGVIGPLAQGTSTGQPSLTRSVLFEPPTGPAVIVNTPLATIVRRMRISPDGKVLAVGGEDGFIRLVSLETYAVIRGFRAHSGRISDLDFSPDSRLLLSTGRDGTARLWRVETGQQAGEPLKMSNTALYSGRLNPSLPERFALFGGNGYLYAKDLKRDKLVTNSKFHTGPVTVAYRPNGRGTYLSAGGDGLLKIRRPEGQRLQLKAHTGRIFDAGFDSSGDLAYTAGYDRQIKIWNMRKDQPTQTPIHVMEGHLKYVLAASISRTEKKLVSGGGDKAVNVWSVDSGKLVARLVGHTSDVEAVAITPDNRFAISSSEDKSLRIWSVENRQQLLSIYFRAGASTYAGLTFDKQVFGDENSGLITVRVDGKEISFLDSNQYDKYIGREISITDH